VPSTSGERKLKRHMQRHLSEATPLPCSDRVAYALASLCVASYEKSTVKKTAGPDVRSREETLTTIRERLDKPFRKLGWRVPDAESITLIDHSHQSETDVRLGGFAVSLPDCVAVVFRGTAYSDEWISNISYAVPAVRNRRQLAGLVTLSFLPGLRDISMFRRLFDFENGFQENAGYANHLEGMVKQTRDFLRRVVLEEQANPDLRTRPLFITGHSLGGAASIIARRRLLGIGSPKALSENDALIASMFGQRLVTVTFGAPPCLTAPEPYPPGSPPVANIIRPSDIVPCLSLDLIGLPFKVLTVKPPATPYHFGTHFMLRRSGSGIAIERCVIKRNATLRRCLVDFVKGAVVLRPFRAAVEGHVISSYAKDMLAVGFPEAPTLT
jgi:hypothetical protein